MGGFGTEFEKLSLQDKNAYLLDSSPTFKSMSPQDRSAYLDEVHYGPKTTAAQTMPKDEGMIGGALSEGSELLKQWKDTVANPENLIPVYGPGKMALKTIGGMAGQQGGLIKRAGQEYLQEVGKLRHPLSSEPNPKLGLHIAEAMMPIAGPMAANLEDKPLGEAVGRGAVDVATLAAPELSDSTLIKATRPMRETAAGKLVESAIGPSVRAATRDIPHEPGEPLVGRAIVREGVTPRLTRRGILGDVQPALQQRGQEIGAAYQGAGRAGAATVDQVLGANLSRELRSTFQPKMDVIRAYDPKAAAVLDKLFSNKPLTLEELHDLKSELGGQVKNFAADQIPVAQELERAAANAINRYSEGEMPGILATQKRYQGLKAGEKAIGRELEAKRGGPVLPLRARGFLGGGGEGGFEGAEVIPTGKTGLLTFPKLLGARMLAGPEALPGIQVPTVPPSVLPLAPMRRGIIGAGGAQPIPGPSPVHVTPLNVGGMPLTPPGGFKGLPSITFEDLRNEPLSPHTPERTTKTMAGAIEGKRSPTVIAREGNKAESYIDRGKRGRMTKIYTSEQKK